MSANQCLSILVARPESAYAPDELTDSEVAYSEYVNLTAVTRLSVNRQTQYDEGDVRALYQEYDVNVEAIITSDSYDLGTYVNEQVEIIPDPPRDRTFDEKLERLDLFFRTQGLAINFRSMPSSIRKLAPGDESKTSTLDEYQGSTGWLIDNFNGPRTIDFNLEMMAGNQAILLTWHFKAKVSQVNVDATTDYLVPKISSEVRLDISDDGDLRILVDGTIYADTLLQLYAARDYLDIVHRPYNTDDLQVPVTGEDWEEEKWAMVNGFLKTVSFNVEKNGRSARFSIKYEQVKSNNAYPLGIRDITFDQTIESGLLGGGFMSPGSAFTMWRNDFSGKVVIPPRMNALYAWYVFHTLMNQQLRYAEMVYDSKIFNRDNPEEPDDEDALVGTGVNKLERMTFAIPLKIKIKNKHFERTMTFDVEYLLLCPLSKIITASCITSRLNNDYYRKINSPNELYEPLSLSQQWLAWNQSVDVGYGYDPEVEGNQITGAVNRPHRDAAGTEILDTGHNYDPYKTYGLQRRQQNVFITTIIDPRDNDPLYDNVTPTYPQTEEQADYDASPPSRAYTQVSSGENDFKSGNTPSTSIKAGTVTRTKWQVNPEASWIKYEQEYEVLETNPVLATESLAPITPDHFTNEPYATQLGLNGTTASVPGSDVPKYKGAFYHGRQTSKEAVTEAEIEAAEAGEPGAKPLYNRKTYAMKPQRYYITVRGSAMRVKYKIPIPTVLKIAGQPAIRVGNGRFKQKSIGGDADLPVYLAMWEQTYTVDKTIESTDILSNIEDTGASILYV